jgi:hypothetical protein
MSILLGKSVDFVVLRRHLNRCGFMDEHVSTFVSQPGASRKLLWHYRVTTPTIMLASKELPYDDHTTGGPCYA